MHCADQRPFLYEDRWVNQAAVPAIQEADLDAISANEWLVQNAPVTTGDISFSAANADADEAGFLEIATGTAIFVVKRITWNQQQPVTSVRLAYAPGFEMHTKI
jgi:GntR family histidine utilization transcriptional repressor